MIKYLWVFLLIAGCQTTHDVPAFKFRKYDPVVEEGVWRLHRKTMAVRSGFWKGCVVRLEDAWYNLESKQVEYHCEISCHEDDGSFALSDRVVSEKFLEGMISDAE